MKKIFLLLSCLLLLAATASAAPFEKAGNDREPIVIGEVEGYGEYDINSQFMEGLRDAVWSNVAEVPGLRLAGGHDEVELMKQVHMNAIVRGHLYNRGTSNAELINYGRQVLGAGYRPTEAELKEKLKQTGTPYSLDSAVAAELREYAQRAGVKYVFFVNFNYAELWLRNSIFNVETAPELRGKTAVTELDYYLVNALTGKVYDGHSSERKTAQQMKVLLLMDFGRGMPVNNMIFGIMDSHMKKIMKKIASEGLKRV